MQRGANIADRSQHRNVCLRSEEGLFERVARDQKPEVNGRIEIGVDVCTEVRVEPVDPAFHQHYTGSFSAGATMVVVAQDNDRQLTLTVGSGPTYKLHPYQNRTFVIDKLEGFRVEFHLRPDGEVDELIFHQPNGTFVASRAQVAASR